LAGKAKLFFVNRTGDFSGLSKEIEVLSNRFLAFSYRFTTSKCIVVECIVSLVQLVAKAIVGIFEVETSDKKLAITK
jgi:hypothetical protein